jgi:hypothetical protein
MNDSSESVQDTTFLSEHRFLILIGLTIAVALVLVSISMTLYATSGAAQLDLSRPGYKSVTSQAINNDGGFKDYPASGKLDAAALSQFKSLYDSQATKAKAIDAYSGDPLNPDALQISAPVAP